MLFLSRFDSVSCCLHLAAAGQRWGCKAALGEGPGGVRRQAPVSPLAPSAEYRRRQHLSARAEGRPECECGEHLGWGPQNAVWGVAPSQEGYDLGPGLHSCLESSQQSIPFSDFMPHTQIETEV